MRAILNILQTIDNSIVGKNIVIFYSGLVGASFSYFTPIEMWIDNNGGYIGFMMYAITLDFIINIITSIKEMTFSFKEILSDLGIKMLAIFGFGILFEGVQHIHSNEFAITDYLLYTVRMMVFLFPVFSASKNMSTLTGGVFPPKGWFKWMDNYNTDLKTDGLEDINNTPEK